jgi:hypothetical protein
MNDTTPQERLEVAQKVNGKRSKSGKTIYPQYIETPEELVQQYRQYANQEFMKRHGHEGDERTVKMMAEMYADLSASRIEHDMPALIFFFQRMLTQR